MQIVCALSGVAPTPEEIEAGREHDDDAPGLPVGWVEIRVTRRRDNPRMEYLRAVKNQALRQALAQVPKADRKAARPYIEVQVEASFAALEAREDFQETLLDQEVVYLAPADRENGLADALAQVAATLGLPPALLGLGAPDDGAGGADDEAEEAAAPPPAVDGPVAGA